MDYNENEIKQGQLVLITEGEYSDFGHLGIFRALKDFNMVEQMNAFRKRPGPMRKSNDPKHRAWNDDPYEFLAVLTRDGYLAEEECSSQWIGSYNNFSREGLIDWS